MIMDFVKSTVGAKIVVAVTGFMFVGFILAHTMGNMLVFLGAEALNDYAQMLQAVPELLWMARIGLIVALVLHVFLTLKLTSLNRAASPQKYAKTVHQKANFASKAMRFGGIAIFFFIFYHLGHFTFGTVNPAEYNVHEVVNGVERHDAYSMLISGFSHWWNVAIYLIATIFLGLHLKHGVQSMVHTLGFNGEKLTEGAEKVGQLIMIVVVLGLGSIPLAIFFGIIGGGHSL
jgi:succinate dehydrogenase cytochrome b subunit